MVLLAGKRAVTTIITKAQVCAAGSQRFSVRRCLLIAVRNKHCVCSNCVACSPKCACRSIPCLSACPTCHASAQAACNAVLTCSPPSDLVISTVTIIILIVLIWADSCAAGEPELMAEVLGLVDFGLAALEAYNRQQALSSVMAMQGHGG